MTSHLLESKLVSKGYVTTDELEFARGVQEQSPKEILEILLEYGILRPEAHARFLALELYRFPYDSVEALLEYEIPERTLVLFSFHLAEGYNALPVVANPTSGMLTLVVEKPLDPKTEMTLLMRMQCHGIRYRLSAPKDIKKAIYYHYGRYHLVQQGVERKVRDSASDLATVGPYPVKRYTRDSMKETSSDSLLEQLALDIQAIEELTGTESTDSHVKQQEQISELPTEPPHLEALELSVASHEKNQLSQQRTDTETTSIAETRISSTSHIQLNSEQHQNTIKHEVVQAEDHGQTQREPTKRQGEETFIEKSGNCKSCGYALPMEHMFCPRCGESNDNALDPYTNRIISKKWKLLEKLGEGGMSVVYKAEHLQSGQLVAIKILDTQGDIEEEQINRFYLEAQASRRLRHPNIIEVQDFGFQESLGFYIVMEMLSGQDFADYLEEKRQKGQTYSLDELSGIFAQVCSAMGYAHKQSVVHRDLKPSNIFLVGDTIKRVKILDFGIAKIQHAGSDRITQAGYLMGTPHYISPEQAKAEPIDHRVDIYALSVIMFEALTGEDLFYAEDPYQYMMRHVYTEPRKLSEVRPELPFPLLFEELVSDGLKKSPDDRPASMEDVRTRLLEAMKARFTHTSKIPNLDSFSEEKQPRQAGQYQLSFAELPKVSVGSQPELDVHPSRELNDASLRYHGRAYTPGAMIYPRPDKAPVQEQPVKTFSEGTPLLNQKKGESRWSNQRANIRSSMHSIPTVNSAIGKAESSSDSLIKRPPSRPKRRTPSSDRLSLYHYKKETAEAKEAGRNAKRKSGPAISLPTAEIIPENEKVSVQQKQATRRKKPVSMKIRIPLLALAFSLLGALSFLGLYKLIF